MIMSSSLQTSTDLSAVLYMMTTGRVLVALSIIMVMTELIKDDDNKDDDNAQDGETMPALSSRWGHLGRGAAGQVGKRWRDDEQYNTSTWCEYNPR